MMSYSGTGNLCNARLPLTKFRAQKAIWELEAGKAFSDGDRKLPLARLFHRPVNRRAFGFRGFEGDGTSWNGSGSP
jgi:hypothetical protein